jgi:hypothetical protein
MPCTSKLRYCNMCMSIKLVVQPIMATSHPRTPHSNIVITVLFKHISEHQLITGLKCRHRQFNKRSLRSRAFARIYFSRLPCSSVLYSVSSPPNFVRVWKTRSLCSPAIYLVYLSLGGFATEHSLVSILIGRFALELCSD